MVRLQFHSTSDPHRWVARLSLLSAAILMCGGCASTPYHFRRIRPPRPDEVARPPVVVDYGQPHKTLDRAAWVVGLPGRVLTLNWETNNHRVSPQTVDKLRDYLEENDLTDVYVAVNTYDPKGQWRRLRENDRISPFWRYSVGALGWVKYTVMPYRVFGGDEYDPFTNSVNLTSDVPALVLAEAAYAKDIYSRRLPGLYATMNDLPVLILWRRSLAIGDVVGYSRHHHDWELEQDIYHVVYPYTGSTTFGPAAHFVPVAGPFLSVGGAAVGHVTGRTVAALSRPQRIQSSPEADPEPSEEVADELNRQRTTQPTPPGEDGVIHAGFQESILSTRRVD